MISGAVGSVIEQKKSRKKSEFIS